VTSDSERQHREAQAMMTQDGTGEAQVKPDGRARGREVWNLGPEKTDAQIRRERDRAQDARVAADMAADDWRDNDPHPMASKHRPVHWQEVF
jgi:hypothetical protein